MHYSNDEMDEEGEVSLCDNCSREVQANIKENGNEENVPKKFFNCG